MHICKMIEMSCHILSDNVSLDWNKNDITKNCIHFECLIRNIQEKWTFAEK